MDIDVIEITPDFATELLNGNTKNRHPKKNHIAALARDMRAGRWQLNGDAIRLNGDGTLLDGQHRLMACVEAGVPFRTLVIMGLPNDALTTIDSGVKRTFADRLSINNVPNATRVAAAVRFAAGLATGELRHIRLTSTELEATYERHPGIADSVRKAEKCFSKMDSAIAAVHYVGTYTGHGQAADDFVEVWRSGVPAYPGCPAHRLRERIISSRASGGTMNKMVLEDTYRLLVSAWLHFYRKSSVVFLKAKSDLSIPGWDRAALGLGDEDAQG